MGSGVQFIADELINLMIGKCRSSFSVRRVPVIVFGARPMEHTNLTRV